MMTVSPTASQAFLAIHTDWLQNSLDTSNVFNKETYSIQSEMSLVDYCIDALDDMSLEPFCSVIYATTYRFNCAVSTVSTPKMR